jgi:lysophospholipase L1-like esterase
MLEAARSRYPVLMIGPAPTADARQNRRIEFLSAGFARLCARLGVPYLDLFTPLSRSALWKKDVAAEDGCHPSARGYALLARRVLRWPAWNRWG